MFPNYVIVNIIVNVQPHCNGHFCWRHEFASPAAEVKCYWDDLRSRFVKANQLNKTSDSGKKHSRVSSGLELKTQKPAHFSNLFNY